MELLQLKYFQNAAETENFSKTAANYRVPVSNISQMIHKLEAELGKKLFDRNANRVFLNESGRRFYVYVKEALAQLENARAAVTDADSEVGGTLSLQIRTNRQVTTRALERFKNTCPGVSLKLDYNTDDRRDFDLIIADRLPEEKGLHRQLFLTETIVLAMEKHHPLAAHAFVAPKELRDEPFISMQKGSSLYQLMISICASAGFTPHIAIECDDPFYARKYVEMGMGVIFMPTFSWRNLFGDNIVLRPIGDFERETYVYWEEGRYMKRSAALFLEVLKEQLAEENGTHKGGIVV